jgi:hypothetical protein
MQFFQSPLHYRTLERNKDKNLKMNNDDFDPFMIFPDRNLTEIVWWCKNMKTLSGKCIR